MSRKATVLSLSSTTSAGISPVTIWQKRQSVTERILTSDLRRVRVDSAWSPPLRLRMRPPGASIRQVRSITAQARCFVWVAAGRCRLSQGWALSARDGAGRDGRSLRGKSLMVPGEPDGLPARPMHVIETIVADVTVGSVSAEWDADRAVTALYSSHYRALVRLAVLLVRDICTAEEVVQDSFVAMHASWRRLRDTEKALSYLRQSVVNRSRSVLRHRVVVDRNAPKPP